MGYTTFSKEKIEEIIAEYNPKRAIDFGSQNDFSYPQLPAPYTSEWYKEKGIAYESIDLNGENNSKQLDLSQIPFFTEDIKDWVFGFDLLVDAGTSEHVRGIDDKFSWTAIYNCWLAKHQLTKIGSILYGENPKTGNWPGHGQNYYTQDFYNNFIKVAGYELLDIGEHAACNNFVDGWNIFATLRKTDDRFPTIEQFSELGIQTS